MTIPVWEVIAQVAAFPEIENGDMVDPICAEGFQILADGLGTLDADFSHLRQFRVIL